MRCKKKKRRKKLGHRFGQPLVPTPSPPSSLSPLQPSPFFLESVPLKDESRGDEDLGRRDRGSWMIAQSPPHIPIGVRPSPLIPLSSSSSSSFPRAPFLTKIYSSVHERSRPFMELEHLPPLLPLLNRARPLTGPDARGDRPGHRNLVAVPSFTSETEAWLDRIQPFRSRSFRRPDAGNACKRMDQDPEGGRGGCGGEFRTGPSGNSPSTGSQNAMVPRFRGTWSPSSKMNPLECGFYRSIARGMLISEVILFDDRWVAIDFFLRARFVVCFVLLACFFYRLRWKYYFEIMECLFIHGGMDGCVFL